MIINTPVSLGELIDKISILNIKRKNVSDKEKVKHINQELSLLKKTLKDSQNNNILINKYLEELIIINSQLWKIEDDLRDYERKKIFNQDFIELARSVYLTNDKRSKIKLEINKIFGSQIIEVKSYKEY